MTVAVSVSSAFPVVTIDDLQSAVRDENNRADLDTDQLRRFIQMVEVELNRRLRVPDMENVATVAVTAGVGVLPNDFLSARGVYDARSAALPFTDPLTLYGGEQRKACALVGQQLMVRPASTETVTLIYYAAIPRLSAEQQSNWLMARHPDVYLHGVNARFANFNADQEAAQREFALFERAIEQIIADGERNRYGGPLIQRAAISQTRGARA